MCNGLRLFALVGVCLSSFSISISSQSTIPIPGKIEVEDYTTFYDLSTGNAGSACRTNDVDLWVVFDAPDGGCNLGATQATEWLGFTINVSQTNTYVLSARVAHPGVGGTFHVEVDSVDVTGTMTVPDTGDWSEWRTIRRHGIALSAGQHTLKLVMDSVNPTTSAVGNFNYLALTRSAPLGGTPRVVPGKIEMEDFDVNADGGSGELAAYHDVTPANLGDATYRFPEAVDIATTGDVGGGYQVGWTEDGEWLAYTVNMDIMNAYELRVRVAHPGVGGTFHMEIDGQDVTGPIQVPDTGAWDNWITITKQTAYLPSGKHVLYMVLDTESSATGALANVNHFELVPLQTLRMTASTVDSGASFAVGDLPEFLLFFSYFGALVDHSVADIKANLILARYPPEDPNNPTPNRPDGFGTEFHGVRMFPNWWEELPVENGNCTQGQAKYDAANLFTPSGGINPTAWAKLDQVLDAAIEMGMIVDLSMAQETVPGLTWAGYKSAMGQLATLLKTHEYERPNTNPPQKVIGAPGVFLDLQNEFQNDRPGLCKNALEAGYEVVVNGQVVKGGIRTLRDIVKGIDPNRLVTASMGGTKEQVAQMMAASQVDFISYHEPRNRSEWGTVQDTWNIAKGIREATNNGPPLYLQEPYPFDNQTDPETGVPWTEERWLRAVTDAKKAGAAAWCWHSRWLFGWSAYPNLADAEVRFLTQMRARVNGAYRGTEFPLRPYQP